MNPRLFCVFLIVNQFHSYCVANTIRNDKLFQVWTHEVQFDSGMSVKWNSEDPYYLTMEMRAPTNGYVGLGFSRSGNMAGADIVIGWLMPDGTPMIRDYHGIENGHPIEDFQQDYDLIAGTEREDGTTILFRRRWDTCDQYDMAIGEDTMRLIWAWHPNDPQLFPSLVFPKHNQASRGVKSVFMKNPIQTRRFPDFEPNSPENKDTKYWDIKVNNVRVESKITTYLCKLVKFPARQGPKHVVGFKPLIDRRNRQFVHHMLLYHCNSPRRDFEYFIDQPEEDCFQANSIYNMYCMSFAFTWAAGSEGEMFPDHVGIPLGDYTEQPTYFKFEIHYDNPDRQSFYDNSGLRIFYTDKLRQHDAGTLFLGHRISPFQMIPQAQESFTTYGICSTECTQNGIQIAGGIKAINVLLHAHLTGKSIKLRHIRNGVELAPIAVDEHFDFNYQQFRQLKDEKSILPGDELLVECSYDTSNRNRMTFGGASTSQEMCQAIMLYYPKTNLTDCRSQPEFNSFFDALKIQNVTGQLLKILHMPKDSDSEFLPDDMFQMEKLQVEHLMNNPFDNLQIMAPVQLQSQSVGEYIRRMNWNDSSLVRGVEKAWRDGNQYMFCVNDGMYQVPNSKLITKIPKYQPYLYDSRSTCRFPSNRNSGILLAMKSHLILISVLLVLL